MITNGTSCLQREKLATAGLDEYFDVVVVSAEFGVAKPDPSIFAHALAQLGSDPEESDGEHAVMIGTALPAMSTVRSPPAFGAFGSTVPRNRVPLIAPT